MSGVVSSQLVDLQALVARLRAHFAPLHYSVPHSDATGALATPPVLWCDICALLADAEGPGGGEEKPVPFPIPIVVDDRSGIIVAAEEWQALQAVMKSPFPFGLDHLLEQLAQNLETNGARCVQPASCSCWLAKIHEVRERIAAIDRARGR